MQEPPVPPGLRTLSPALERFIEFVTLDKDLIEVAAELSSVLEARTSNDDLRRSIAQLAAEEREAFLLRLATGEPHLSLALNRRLGVLDGKLRGEATEPRSVGALLAAVEVLREHRRRERAAAAEARRVTEMLALAGHGDETWREVDALIQRSQAKAYGEAVQLLKRLQGLAEYQSRQSAFGEHLDQIRNQYRRRPALMKLLREAGLIDS